MEGRFYMVCLRYFYEVVLQCPPTNVRGCLHAQFVSEPHWRKRRREAMERKRNLGFYSKTAGKGFDDMDEGTSFWGHKGLQRRFGKVNGEKPKGLDD